jgi:hypothetical protein
MGYYEDNLHYVNVFLASGVLRFMKFSCQESEKFFESNTATLFFDMESRTNRWGN